VKFVRALAKFLWDFFVGDTPELFAGTLAVVTFGWLAHRWLGSANSAYLLPAAVSAVMAWSLARARRR
jgi:hypothetical protein